MMDTEPDWMRLQFFQLTLFVYVHRVETAGAHASAFGASGSAHAQVPQHSFFYLLINFIFICFMFPFFTHLFYIIERCPVFIAF